MTAEEYREYLKQDYSDVDVKEMIWTRVHRCRKRIVIETNCLNEEPILQKLIKWMHIWVFCYPYVDIH